MQISVNIYGFILIVCKDEWPSDITGIGPCRLDPLCPTSCTKFLEFVKPFEENICQKKWNERVYSLPDSLGKVQDWCKKSCNTCDGRYWQTLIAGIIG